MCMNHIYVLCSDNTSAGTFKRERKFALALRPQQNKGVNAVWTQLKELAEVEIEATLADLPPPLREQAQNIPIILERRPNAGLQGEGIMPDSLGLFAGSEFSDPGDSVLPPQIILFMENLWEYAEGDEKVYIGEIRVTFLHELGHYFGLGEDDLTARGLD